MQIAAALDRIATALPMAERPGGVDTVKLGVVDRDLTGVAVSFMATYAVLERCRERGLNLVVTHEPTAWNHLDETDWLGNDPVWAAKCRLIEDAGLVIFRLHDRLHRGGWPDDIAIGVVEALGWIGNVVAETRNLVRLPGMSLRDVVAHCRARLGGSALRCVGDPDQVIRGVALMPGASGGRRQIQALQSDEVDLVICGESPEWETCEYARDACASGRPKAYLALGHANSEEAGMAALAQRIATWIPEVPVEAIPAGDPFAGW